MQRGSTVLGSQRGHGGNPHSRSAVVSPIRAWDQDSEMQPLLTAPGSSFLG
ncbi:hypothetical protein [Moorena sp. SIO3H5]|uniref:hypothetical protein n=1 Tax=Moorena sp. SIO3H5 TaxID=2607834 RepID=UPI0013B82008|nr:hypothetical protein [Moorena sp. SIO3H5]NEO68890.1 hypothetical protein [Moorena sp. SIO3H5]